MVGVDGVVRVQICKSHLMEEEMTKYNLTSADGKNCVNVNKIVNNPMLLKLLPNKSTLCEFGYFSFFQAGFTAGYLTIAPFMDSIDRKKLFVSACLTMALSLAVLGVTLHDFSDDFTASIAGTFLANVMTYAPGTVFMHVSGPPKRPVTKLLEVKMKSNPNKNCIGLKFSPLCPFTANFIQIGRFLYK